MAERVCWCTGRKNSGLHKIRFGPKMGHEGKCSYLGVNGLADPPLRDNRHARTRRLTRYCQPFAAALEKHLEQFALFTTVARGATVGAVHAKLVGAYASSCPHVPLLLVAYFFVKPRHCTETPAKHP